MNDPDDAPPASDQTIEHAADGNRLFPACRTLADFVRMQEDGQFDADVTAALAEMAAAVEDQVRAYGRDAKIKAKLTLTFDITRMPAGFYTIASDFTLKTPKEKREQSVAWLTDDNNFTPNQPRQGQFFGVREVPVSRSIRN